MTARTSAGLLLHRPAAGGFEVLVAHMGGPFWARKDAGAWTVPKGEPSPDETLHAAALREFAEELGVPPPAGEDVSLGEVRQSGGKVVTVWAREGDLDVSRVRSNLVEVEWPPRSGRRAAVPEIDRAAWVSPDEARRVLVTAQRAFVDRLAEHLAARP